MVYLYDRRRISSLYRFVWMLLIAFNVLACEETELFEEIAAQKPESSSMKILAGDVPTSEITSKPEDVLIRHPLKNVKLINGKVPAIDIKNSPNTNKRFAYGGQTFQLSENGPVVNKSGVIELERHQITEVSEKTSQVPSLHTQL